MQGISISFQVRGNGCAELRHHCTQRSIKHSHLRDKPTCRSQCSDISSQGCFVGLQVLEWAACIARQWTGRDNCRQAALLPEESMQTCHIERWQHCRGLVADIECVCRWTFSHGSCYSGTSPSRNCGCAGRGWCREHPTPQKLKASLHTADEVD